MFNLIRRINHTVFTKMKDEKGNSLIALAVINDDVEMINLLCRFGINIDFANIDGDTPLHLAIAFNKPNAIYGLIEMGANEKLKNNAGMKPWELSDNGRVFASSKIKYETALEELD